MNPATPAAAANPSQGPSVTNPTPPIVSSLANLSRGNPRLFLYLPLALARVRRMVKTKDLAECLDYSPATLSKVLSGREFPAPWVALELCRLLDVPVSEVYPAGVPPIKPRRRCA